MKTCTFCLMALAAALSAGATSTECPKGKIRVESTALSTPAEPAAAGLPALSRFIYGTPGEEYPIYGGVPKEFWPFGTVPYYRYFVTRMPFRGPGRDYPPPTDLKSLRIGLVNSPRY